MVELLFIMSPERRRPKEGTRTATILRLLEEGRFHREIVEQTSFTPRQVTSFRSDIYRRRLLPMPPEERRKKDWAMSHPGHPHTPDSKKKISDANKGRQLSEDTRKKISLVKERSWRRIERYVRWGMYPREIAEATLIDGEGEERSLTIKQASNVLYRARRRGAISKPTREGLREIRRNAQGPREEIRQRAALWLEVGDIFAKKGLEEIPTRRDDWLLLMNYYQVRREMGMTGNNGAMTAFNRKLDDGTLERLRPWIFAIRDATRITPSVDLTKLHGAMVVPGEVRLGELD